KIVAVSQVETPGGLTAHIVNRAASTEGSTSMYLAYSGHLDWWRKRYFDKILDTLNPNAASEILDYGCGPGDFIALASKRNLRVEGVDISDRSIAMARERGFVVAKKTTKDLRAEEKRYDAIIAQSVIEHVPDGLALVIDFADLLKPGGTLVLSAPTPGPYFWDDPTHIRPYTPRSFRALAELAGLES